MFKFLKSRIQVGNPDARCSGRGVVLRVRLESGPKADEQAVVGHRARAALGTWGGCLWVGRWQGVLTAPCGVL